MEQFNDLQNIWDRAQPKTAVAMPDRKKIQSKKTKILHEQRNGAIVLLCTAALITGVAFWLDFKHWYTYFALALVILICLSQAALMYFHYKKCASIDDSLAPKQHLQQWENYQDYLLKQLRWNMPVYYIMLNLAMGLYFIEIFDGRPILNVVIFIAIYLAWMLYAYFYLAKKKKQQAVSRIETIITELQLLEAQF